MHEKHTCKKKVKKVRFIFVKQFRSKCWYSLDEPFLTGGLLSTLGLWAIFYEFIQQKVYNIPIDKDKNKQILFKWFQLKPSKKKDLNSA